MVYGAARPSRVIPRRARAALARSRNDSDIRAALDELVDAGRPVPIAQLRLAVGITQTELGKSLGMTQAEVSKLERRNNLQLRTLAQYITATGGQMTLYASYGEIEIPIDVTGVN
jgi:hypothetical protein